MLTSEVSTRGGIAVLIKELPLVEYLTGLDFTLPPLGKFLVLSAVRREGVLLGAYLNEGGKQKVVGLLALGFRKGANIEYLFVQDQFRRQGVGAALVAGAAAMAQHKEASVLRARALMGDSFGAAFARILEQAGFEVCDRANLIRVPLDARSKETWEEFMRRRGSRICKRLRDDGYWVVSFAEAGGDVLQRFQEDRKLHFPTHLDPNTFLNNREHRAVLDYSFIALKGQEPAAYSLVTTIDDSTLSFQHLAASFKYQGLGAFLLPIVAFAEKATAEGRFKVFSAMIYERNERMNRLVEKFLRPFATAVTEQRFYLLHL